MPLNTREGVADAPIDPGARTLCEPCDFGPLAKLWRLIVPWKPLPFEMPETLTSSPGENASHVTVSPISSSPASLRNSRTTRCAEVSAFFRWPSSAFVSTFSLHGAERELDGLVAVALDRPDRGHRARAGFEHGHALDLAVVEEPLRHPEFAREDRSHHDP